MPETVAAEEPPSQPRLAEFKDPQSGQRWVVDMEFLSSNWRCIWGEGCLGIHEYPAESEMAGCCSVGAALIDEQEAMLIAAMAATIAPEDFQFFEHARTNGVFAAGSRRHTAVVQGGCIFLNRPGFSEEPGCVLHQEALRFGDDPIDYKPSICWQLPLLIDAKDNTLRAYSRSDWGEEGQAMAWCCTAKDETSLANAFSGSSTVAESMFSELVGLVGDEVAVQIRTAAQTRH